MFILCRNCVVLPHCTVLHRNCDVTALRCRVKVKLILTEMQWSCGDLPQKIIDISVWQRNSSVVRPDLYCGAKHVLVCSCYRSECGNFLNESVHNFFLWIKRDCVFKYHDKTVLVYVFSLLICVIEHACQLPVRI